MKKGTIYLGLLMLIFASAVNAQDKGPAAVSPASELGIAKVGTVCPTFSWTAVDWAAAYRVEVFAAGEQSDLTYDKMAAQAHPLLVKEIQGAATSWTPSVDERLGDEGVYIWFVQALDEYGAGTWSQGRMFMIEAVTGFSAIEEAVGDTLERHGIDKDIIDEVRANMSSAAGRGGLESQDSSLPVSIQGHESDDNTWYGLYAGYALSTGGLGDFNSFFGYYAGYSNNNSLADYNTFMGYRAGYTNLSGGYNTFIGHRSGMRNTSGVENTFLGNYAGYNNTTGYNNVSVGHEAGYSNQTGDYNVFLGQHAGYSTTSNYNTFVGSYCGEANTTGTYNVFLGYKTGQKSVGGSYNTFIGYLAGYENTSGQRNAYLGYDAGRNNVTGSGNVCLGYQAGRSETGSDKLYIDNSSTTTPLIWGDFSSNIVSFHGKVGIDTKSTVYPMEMQKTGTNASFVVNRTDGATNFINATANHGNFGTVNNYPFRILINSTWRLRVNTDNSLDMVNGASCTSGGTWLNASSRELKENIQGLTADEAFDALKQLNPVKYNYKVDKEEEYVGFIAEDVPDLVSTKDRKSMSSMDVVAVLTRVVQEQQKLAEKQQRTITDLQKKITELENEKK